MRRGSSHAVSRLCISGRELEKASGKLRRHSRVVVTARTERRLSRVGGPDAFSVGKLLTGVAEAHDADRRLGDGKSRAGRNDKATTIEGVSRRGTSYVVKI